MKSTNAALEIYGFKRKHNKVTKKVMKFTTNMHNNCNGQLDIKLGLELWLFASREEGGNTSER